MTVYRENLLAEAAEVSANARLMSAVRKFATCGGSSSASRAGDGRIVPSA